MPVFSSSAAIGGRSSPELTPRPRTGILIRGVEHCAAGRHEWTAENAYVAPGGAVQCRSCKREAVRRWERRNPELARAQQAARQRRRRILKRNITVPSALCAQIPSLDTGALARPDGLAAISSGDARCE